FGQRFDLPLLIAPTAFQALACPAGELATAGAAAAAGTATVLSTLSSHELESVAAAHAAAARADGPPPWFQLYPHRDTAITDDLIARAEAAGYGALVVTVDVPVQGRRERDAHNRFHLPPAARPANLTRYVDLDDLSRERSGSSALDRLIASSFPPDLSWASIERMRSRTRLPLLLKGVLHPDDARRAPAHGVDGVIVSNHGGRQLDSAVAALDALPAIAEVARDTDLVVLVDGGIRRGTDVLKALILGARAVLIGRPMVWALAWRGRAGGDHLLALLRGEIATSLALLGCQRLDELDPSHLVRIAP
ncbi:MAG: alpha-hydroxy acid oxidase, partial [Acidobacteriota bacterium]